MSIEKRFEEDDPYAFVGIGFPCPDDYDAAEQMARTFIEEYAMMGFSRERILALFRGRQFQGPNAVYRSRGEDYVRSLIEEVFDA